MLDHEAITDILQHRYPMLLVDRVLELAPRERIRAIKLVSVGDAIAPGPGRRMMLPQTLVLESMAQIGGMPMHTPGGPSAYIVAVDKLVFDNLVYPGDVLEVEANVLWHREKMFKSVVRACTESGMVATAEMLYAHDIFKS
jgi:3-hydroxyacyl-[acyl-carrier-protein] dehydratase